MREPDQGARKTTAHRVRTKAKRGGHFPLRARGLFLGSRLRTGGRSACWPRARPKLGDRRSPARFFNEPGTPPQGSLLLPSRRFDASSPTPSQGDGCDVCIIGSGLSGASLAWALERAGVSVTIIDARASYPACFKAEKIEPEQAALLHGLHLYPVVSAVATPIRGVDVARRGRAIDHVSISQLGAPYHDMANAVREALPLNVCCRRGRVVETRLSDERQTVTMADGAAISARLVVLATGAGGGLHEALGVTRQVLSDHHSVAFGFSIEPLGPRSRFPFDAVTYLPDSIRDAIDYLTLFAMPDGMRANLFAYLPPRDARVRSVAATPQAALTRLMPGLERVIGPWRPATKVEVSATRLWRAVEGGRAGVVLLGDAFQTACPSTGSGLSKVFTDVTVLAELIPRWLATRGLGAEKTRMYYEDARKVACDRASLAAAMYRRRLNTDRGLRMRLHRARIRAAMAWSGQPSLGAMA